MQPTTGLVGGSRARVIYHTPGKSFAWLHKDGSFADFQKALRARLNIPKNEPLVVKQIDGDYMLDIETEEDYEAFCHFAKSASQLHISVNGGLRNQLKTGEAATTSSVDASTVLPLNPALHPPPESEDPTLGKRKASQITTDPQAVPSVIQKRKKRRKVVPAQSISAANDSTTAEPPEPEVERGVIPRDVTRDAPSTSAGADTNHSVVPQKQTKTRKYPVASHSDSTPVDSAERRVGPPTEPAESSKAGKRGKTVVLDLSTVIPSPTAAQEPPSTSTSRPHSPVTKPPPPMTKATKKPPAKRKAKTPGEPSGPAPANPPVPRPNVADEPVLPSATTKPKPPVSKSGLPRPQVYVEIVTKKRKTGETDGPGTVEKETKPQESVKKAATVVKRKRNPAKPKNAEVDPNAPGIQEIMDVVIAAAVEDARKRASSSGATTDVSENLTPLPQNKSKSTVRKPRLADASSLGAASSATLLEASPVTVNSDSTAARKGVGTRKSRPEPSLSPETDNSSLVSDVHRSYYGDLLALRSLVKNGDKPSTPLTAPPPNQEAVKKAPLAKTQPEEESASSEDGDPTPKKKPAPVSDPNDELDAFLHAPTHPSQKSVLDELPSDSEDEEEEAEREDMELDEEDEVSNSKAFGHGHSNVIARVGSSSGDDSDSESVAASTVAKANQAKANTQITHVSEIQDVVPSSDLEDEEEPLPQPMKSTNTSTNVVPPASSTSDSPEPHMTSISNLKSAGQALNFFNEHVLDKPDPIEDDASHVKPPDDLSEDTEDPIENADTTSTPKHNLVQRMKGRNKTAGPVATRKTGAGSKSTQSSLTSPPNSMLPPPTPSRDLKGNLTFGQPLDQSTPAVPGVSRKKRLVSKTIVPAAPAHTWTTLPQGEQSTQSVDSAMVDELISSPTESVAKPPKATPVKKPPSSGSAKQTPLFFPGTSQYPIPSSDIPAAEEPFSEEEEEEEEEEKVIVPPPSRVLRPNRTTTPYRSLSDLASQRSIFSSTPIGPVGPTPVNKLRAKLGPKDDDDDEEEEEEDSGVSDSDSVSTPPSHIPKGRRAGTGNGNGVRRRSQLAMFL